MSSIFEKNYNSTIFNILKKEYKNIFNSPETENNYNKNIQEWLDEPFNANEQDERTNGTMVDMFLDDVYSALDVDDYLLKNKNQFKKDATYILYKLSIRKNE
jgi:hypothetical protein